MDKLMEQLKLGNHTDGPVLVLALTMRIILTDNVNSSLCMTPLSLPVPRQPHHAGLPGGPHPDLRPGAEAGG